MISSPEWDAGAQAPCSVNQAPNIEGHKSIKTKLNILNRQLFHETKTKSITIFIMFPSKEILLTTIEYHTRKFYICTILEHASGKHCE